MRTGQLSTFVILALIVMILVFITRPGILTSSSTGTQQVITTASSDARSAVQSIVQGCLDEALIDGVQILGMQGGYIYPETFPGFVPYASWNVGLDYLYGYDFLPSIPEMEDYQLAPYIADSLLSCTDTLDALIDQGIHTDSDYPDVTVTIGNDEVSAVVSWPTTIYSGDAQSTIETFSSRIPAKIPAMHTVASQLIDLQVQDPGHIRIHDIENLAFEPTVVQLYPDVEVTLFVDSSTSIRGSPYTFAIGSLYSPNRPPVFIEAGTIEVGSHGYHLTARDPDGDSLEYFGKGDGVTVSIDGVLTASPGTHRARIFVFDTEGHSDVRDVEVRA